MPKKYSKINELILTFFYCGKAKFAPGTFGTIGALLFWVFVNNYFVEENFPVIFQYFFWIILTTFFCLYAFYEIPNYHLLKNAKDIDHKSIVIDEAVQTISSAVDAHGAPRRHICDLACDSGRYSVQSARAPRCGAHQRCLRNKADTITVAFANLDAR